MRRTPLTHPRPDRPLEPMPWLACEVDAQIARLKEEGQWQTAGRNAITLVKEDAFRVVLLALREGVKLHPHHAPGPFTLHVLRGGVRVTAHEQTITVAAGGLLAFRAGLEHDVEALEDAAILLTMHHPPISKRTMP